MAQLKREEQEMVNQETAEMEKKESSTTTSAAASFKFNAQAPEFVPRSHTQVPISGYFYPCFHLLGGGAGSADWLYVADQDPVHFISNSNGSLPNSSKNLLTHDIQQKIIKQVRHLFPFLSFPFLFFSLSSVSECKRCFQWVVVLLQNPNFLFITDDCFEFYILVVHDSLSSITHFPSPIFAIFVSFEILDNVSFKLFMIYVFSSGP